MSAFWAMPHCIMVRMADWNFAFTPTTISCLIFPAAVMIKDKILGNSNFFLPSQPVFRNFWESIHTLIPVCQNFFIFHSQPPVSLVTLIYIQCIKSIVIFTFKILLDQRCIRLFHIRIFLI